jgi:hypothetical protein
MRLLVIGGLLVFGLAVSMRSNSNRKVDNLQSIYDGSNGTYTVTGTVVAGTGDGRTMINVGGSTIEVFGVPPEGRGQGTITLAKQGDGLSISKFEPTSNGTNVELQPYVRSHNGRVYGVASNGQLLEISPRINSN